MTDSLISIDLMDAGSEPQPNLYLMPVSAQQQPPADQHPARAYLASLGQGSQPTMRGSLQVVAKMRTNALCDWETMPWHLLRVQHTTALRATLEARYAAAKANKMLAAVRGVLRAAWELGQLDADAYHRAISVQVVRGEAVLRGRIISAVDQHALLSACQYDPHIIIGARNAALLAVLYGSGLRRAEAAGLTVSDYNPETGSLRVREGKGNKGRLCYTAKGERHLLEAWLRIIIH